MGGKAGGGGTSGGGEVFEDKPGVLPCIALCALYRSKIGVNQVYRHETEACVKPVESFCCARFLSVRQRAAARELCSKTAQEGPCDYTGCARREKSVSCKVLKESDADCAV